MDQVKLAVVIPTLNAEKTLAATLKSLRSGRALGLVSEVVVADGGSGDGTRHVTQAFRARPMVVTRGRGSQLAAGARAALGDRNLAVDWLLFLHADTTLSGSWDSEVASFCSVPGNRETVGVFGFALDDERPAARRLERLVNWRTRVLGLPYGDQGLVIHRDFYRSLGGFQTLPIMEDVDLIRRVGRRRLHVFDATATTSAVRYQRSGYVRRSARNLLCLLMYFLGLPPRLIARVYQ